MLLKLIMLIGLVVWATNGCPNIKAWNGKFIKFDSDKDCTYILNGVSVEKSTKITDIRAYGLLQVTCSDCSYNVVSSFGECDDCIICAHNEGIDRCKSLFLPMTISIVISIAMSTAILMLLTCLDSKYHFIETALASFHQNKKNRKDRRNQKTLGLLREELELRQLKSEMEGAHLSPYNQASQKNALYPDLQEQNEQKKRKGGKGGISPSLSLLSLAIANTLSVGKACDNMLFMNSMGTLYVDDQMNQVSTGLGVLHTGSKLCLKFANGTEESITLNSMMQSDVYTPSYKACEFDVEVRSFSKCLGTNLCWDETSCNGKTRYSAVGPDAYNVPQGQTGCLLSPNLSTDLTCVHETSCIWYYWKLNPKVNTCDTIYRLTDSQLIAHLSHTDTKGNTIPFSISEANPLLTSPLIMHLVSMTGSKKRVQESIRRHGEIFMYTDAGLINNGIAGQLGDFQMPLIGNETYYPTWSVKCSQDGSRMQCLTADHGYSRSLIIDSKAIVDVTKISRQSISVNTEVRGTMSFMMRGKESYIQIVKAASCSFRLESVYGCSGCDDLPFIIISAFDIVSTGIMPFSSNCSFYLHEASCSMQPQRIPMMDNYDSCSIKIIGTNQSLDVNVNYEFRGQIFKLGMMSYRSVDNFSDKLVLSIQSPSFLSSLQISMGIGIASTVIITLIKSITRYSAYKVGRTESEA